MTRFAQWKWDVLPGKTIHDTGRICLQFVGVEFVAEKEVVVSLWQRASVTQY
jgi:hypothetical protein